MRRMRLREEEERERLMLERERAKRASFEIPEEEESLYSSKRNSIEFVKITDKI